MKPARFLCLLDPSIPFSRNSFLRHDDLEGLTIWKPLIDTELNEIFFTYPDKEVIHYLEHSLASLHPIGFLSISRAYTLNPDYPLDSWVLIQDHINWNQHNPMTALSQKSGKSVEFHDIKQFYQNLAQRVERNAGPWIFDDRRGTLIGFDSPSLFSPAEIQWLRASGGDLIDCFTLPLIFWCFANSVPLLPLAWIAQNPQNPSPLPSFDFDSFLHGIRDLLPLFETSTTQQEACYDA